jgi:AsmA protein
MKALKITALCIAALLVAGALAFALGIPVGFLVKPINDRIEASSGYRLRVDGQTWLSFWPTVTLAARDVNVSREGDPARRFSAQNVQISVAPASIFSGRPKITDIALGHPVLHAPLLRERLPPSARADGLSRGGAATPAPPVTVDRISVTDGAIAFVSERGNEESHIDHLDLTAVLAGSENSIDIRARWDDRPVHLVIRGPRLLEGFTGANGAIEYMFEAPDLLQTMSGTANIRVDGTLLTVDGWTGSIGPATFSGRTIVDFASKPLIKVDISAGRLAIPVTPASPPPSGDSARPTATATQGSDKPAGWSDQTVNLDGLNYFDADVQFSASELLINAFRLAPISMHATVQRGVVQVALTGMGLYGGTADGTFGLDASGRTPSSAMRVNVNDVRAQPLLSDLIDFRSLDGRMRAVIDVRATGASQRAAISTLNGSVEFGVQDGQIRGMNIPKMVRGLTTNPFFGWQDIPTESTDFSELRALFRIADGRASTEDLRLASPLVRMTGTGSADLVNRTLAFKLDPKLVMSLEGQGGPADPVGLGVPVIVDGPWSEPHIYPDIAGILENPDAAYARLRALGQGLFGKEHGTAGVDTLLQGLGTLLNAPKDDHKGDRKDEHKSSPNERQSQTPANPDFGQELLRQLLRR